MNTKYTLFSLFYVLMLMNSCRKEPMPLASNNTQTSVQPQTGPPSSISGQEFIFESLMWHYYHSGAGSPWWDEQYLVTPEIDAFKNSSPYFRNSLVDVSIKLDTTSNWSKVSPEGEYNSLEPVQYIYTFSSPRFVVHVWPVNQILVGRKATIRIRFL